MAVLHFNAFLMTLVKELIRMHDFRNLMGSLRIVDGRIQSKQCFRVNLKLIDGSTNFSTLATNLCCYLYWQL